MDNYPPGTANDPDAPWNDKHITIPVKITMTVSCEAEVEVINSEDIKEAVDSLVYNGELDDFWDIHEIYYEQI